MGLFLFMWDNCQQRCNPDFYLQDEKSWFAGACDLNIRENCASWKYVRIDHYIYVANITFMFQQSIYTNK